MQVVPAVAPELLFLVNVLFEVDHEIVTAQEVLPVEEMEVQEVKYLLKVASVDEVRPWNVTFPQVAEMVVVQDRYHHRHHQVYQALVYHYAWSHL